MAFRRTLALSVGAVAGILASAAFPRGSADFCDGEQLARAPHTPGAYARRAQGAYCDGNVIVPNAGRLEIVSVVSGAASGDPAVAPLVVNLARGNLPDDLEKSDLHLIAVSLSSSGSYQLDTGIPAARASFSLGKESGLAQLRLTAADVGWVAELPDYKGRRVIVPVAFSNRSTADISVLVRPALHSLEVSYQLLHGDEVVGRGTGTRRSQDDSLYEIRIPAAGTPALVGLKVWSRSTADDVELDQFYLARSAVIP